MTHAIILEQKDGKFHFTEKKGRKTIRKGIIESPDDNENAEITWEDFYDFLTHKKLKIIVLEE